MCTPPDSREVLRTEAHESSTEVEGAGTAPTSPSNTVVFLGTSLTAGYGLEDPDTRFSALIRERILRDKLPFSVVNAGVSGNTSAGGLDRLDWVLRTPLRVLVLELGANDGLRGLPLEALANNLHQVIQTTRERYPESEIIVVGMEAPPNLGPDYTERFRQVFREVAAEHDAHLVPFLLEGVAGFSKLNQADGIHPNAEGHRIVADNVWKVLKPVLLGIQTSDGGGVR